MMATKSFKPVTRESSAMVRDRGLRAVMVTIVGGVIELRAKGLRTRETMDVASCYYAAVKQRVTVERAEAARERRRRRR
jgi:hypothetical protein